MSKVYYRKSNRRTARCGKKNFFKDMDTRLRGYDRRDVREIDSRVAGFIPVQMLSDYKISVDILSGVVEGRFPRRALSAVLEWLNKYREQLIDDWEQLYGKTKQILPRSFFFKN